MISPDRHGYVFSRDAGDETSGELFIVVREAGRLAPNVWHGQEACLMTAAFSAGSAARQIGYALTNAISASCA